MLVKYTWKEERERKGVPFNKETCNNHDITAVVHARKDLNFGGIFLISVYSLLEEENYSVSAE